MPIASELLTSFDRLMLSSNALDQSLELIEQILKKIGQKGQTQDLEQAVLHFNQFFMTFSQKMSSL